MSSSGFFVGAANALHDKHVEDVNNALGQRKSILDLYGSLLQNPNYADAAPEIVSEIGRLSSIEPGKLGKEFSKGYQVAPILEPSIQRAHAQAQGQPPPQTPNMAAGAPAPPSPVSAPPVGMDALGPMITTPPGQPAATPPPAQVAAQADAVGSQQGALPGVNTIVPPAAASASAPPPSTSVLPPEPIKPLTPRFMDPGGWKKYEDDSKAYDDLKKAVLTHQIERGQMTDDRKSLMKSVGIDPTAEGMAKATPEQLRMLEFMAGGNPGTSRKDVITVNPGQQLYDPNTGKMVATGGAKPLTDAEQKDQQDFAEYAQTIGIDPAQLTNADKSIVRQIDKISDPLVKSAVHVALVTKGKPLTAQELNATIAKAEKSKADMLRPPGASDIGTWTLAEDENGKPVQMNSKTGAVRPVSGVQRSGTAAKQAAADEKKTGPAKAAISYANDYITNGSTVGPDGKPLNGKPEYTGAGDEALMEKFFEIAKPSSGFRMSQPQIDMLKNAQGWKDSAAAKVRHIATGTWFSDQQRQQIASTMKQVAKANGISLNVPSSVSAPPSGNSVDDLVKKYGGR